MPSILILNECADCPYFVERVYTDEDDCSMGDYILCLGHTQAKTRKDLIAYRLKQYTAVGNYTKNDLYDQLLQYRTPRGDIDRYGCPLTKDFSTAFENCECCEYNIENGYGCKQRFSEVSISDNTRISEIAKDQSGRITKYVTISSDNGKPCRTVHRMPIIPMLEMTIPHLIQAYGDDIKIAIVENAITYESYQVTAKYARNAVNDVKGVNKLTGKFMSIKGWYWPVWTMKWFVKE